MLSAVISSVFSYPAMRLASQPVHQGYVHSGPLVLGAAPLKLPTPTADRDQTVSRRFKPSSRTTLNGEQPYPWDRLQPQDVMSRHRGAKLPRRYELLGGISLFSPEYLLSVERWPFHARSPTPCSGPGSSLNDTRLVFQGWLHENWRSRFTASQLSYTGPVKVQCKATVKVHGVFPSSLG